MASDELFKQFPETASLSSASSSFPHVLRLTGMRRAAKRIFKNCCTTKPTSMPSSPCSIAQHKGINSARLLLLETLLQQVSGSHARAGQQRLTTDPTETNMQLKPELDALRADAARTFHQAHELMQSWTALEAQQSQAEQVSLLSSVESDPFNCPNRGSTFPPNSHASKQPPLHQRKNPML